MIKIPIDKEIEILKKELDAMEEISPEYLSNELKDLQSRVLTTHSQIDVFLGNRILDQISKEEILGTEMLEKSRGIVSLISSFGERRISFSKTAIKMIEDLTFRNKLAIVEDFKDGIPAKVLGKLNKYRIEFAHPKGFDLRTKYNYNTSKGRLNIRDLLRCLAKTMRELDEYAHKTFPNYYARK